MVATTAASISASAQTLSASGASDTPAVSVCAAQQHNRQRRKPGKVNRRLRFDKEKKKDNSPDNPAARTRTISVKNSG